MTIQPDTFLDRTIAIEEAALAKERAMNAYDRAISYAAERGATDGKNAAGWYFDGNTSDYRTVLQGMDDGDPAILDTLPAADLSGEWADRLTGPQLVDDARYAAGLQHDQRHDLYAESYRETCEACNLVGDAFSDICDAYETAFNDAASAEIERVARYHTV